MRKNLLFLMLLLLSAGMFAQPEISSRLARTLQNSSSSDYIQGIIFLRDQVDIEQLDARLYQQKASLSQRANTVITALMNKAEATQGNLKSYLSAKMSSGTVFKYESYWIANMIVITAKKDVYAELMNSMEIAQIDLDAVLQYDRPEVVSHNAPKGIESTEPGLKIVGADKLWRMGITGQGRLLMNIDTGVQFDHPALAARFRGTRVPMNQAWFDPAGSTSPSDCDGHGTHTMGIMVGRAPSTGDTVGMAINAEWIAAKTICTSPHTSNSVAAFQWALNPDGNPSTITDMPDAISCSWYDPDVTDECNGIYKTTLNSLEAAGIAVVFSAGNNGPSASTITKPKNISTDEVNAFSVANIDGAVYLSGNNNPIASSSSRGPSACGGTGSLLIKPEVSAPGTSVRSSYNGGGYSSLTGTSMASPHVAGAIALLKQAAPTLTGRQLKLALYNTAKDLGTAGEDNNYGKGLIDVYAAWQTLGTPDTVAPTPITDLSVINPTSNSLTLRWSAPRDTSPGGATAYFIKYANVPINDTIGWSSATLLPNSILPDSAGRPQTFRVDSLPFNKTLYFSVRSRDMWGNISRLSNSPVGVTLGAPKMTVTPDSISKLLNRNEVKTDTVKIRNTSVNASTMDFTVAMQNSTFPSAVAWKIEPASSQVAEYKGDGKPDNEISGNGMGIEGSGGPDSAGYKWIDSDAPNGPQYVWNDIAATGTPVTTWIQTGTFTGTDEAYAGPFSLGFNFKYYNNVKTQIYVSTNGVLLFNAPTSNIFSNVAIPTAAAPNDIIAPFWDDLDGKTTGTVHYKQVDPQTFVIQYTNWLRYSGTASYTFQVVLKSNGRIFFYFKEMTGTLNSATTGIENATGTVGLQVAFNSATYLKNNLAVMFAADPDWLQSNLLSGTIANGQQMNLILTFRSEDYAAGNYRMELLLRSNDPTALSKVVPVNMRIEGVIPVELTSLAAQTSGNTVNVLWSTATETNNKGFSVQRKAERGEQWSTLGFVPGKGTTSEKQNYAFTDNVSQPGKYQYRLIQSDFDGKEHISQIAETEVYLPGEFSLSQNYPNPFNPVTSITFSVPENAEISLVIFNSLGERVKTLVNGVKEAGYHTVRFDGSGLTSGTYIYTLRYTVNGKTSSISKKLSLLK